LHGLPLVSRLLLGSCPFFTRIGAFGRFNGLLREYFLRALTPVQRGDYDFLVRGAVDSGLGLRKGRAVRKRKFSSIISRGKGGAA
jgi:hypothetical protein